MSERTRKYSDGEIGKLRIVEDFLPAPDELVPREDNVKVTLSLSRRSVEFFKREAGKARVPYQRMVRALVDSYARQNEKRLTVRETSKPSVGSKGKGA
jgi:predicted DNA binding CopG/RHH family protein